MYRHSKFSGMRFRLDNMKPGSTPFCIPHQIKCFPIMPEHAVDMRFLKWMARPQSACKLYWKLHPDEYRRAFGCQ